MVHLLAIYVFFGCFVGLLAGLMGSGGAMIIVPILHFTLNLQGVDPSLIHRMAIATCMMNILFTSSMSTYAHYKRGVVPLRSVFWIIPGILVGAFLGSLATRYIPAQLLTLGFCCFLVYASVQMFIQIRPKPTRHLPGPFGQICMGLLIGGLSGMLGVAGAMITMPLLLVCNVPILSVIALAGAFGFPIAVAGCTGYVLAGWGNPGLPPYSLGYIYLPALIGLIPASVLFAPLGVKISHALPQVILRRALGVFMVIIAFRLFYSAIVP